MDEYEIALYSLYTLYWEPQMMIKMDEIAYSPIRIIRIIGVFIPIQKKQKFYIRQKKAIILIILIIKFIIV